MLFSTRASVRESSPELLGSEQLGRLGAFVELSRWESMSKQGSFGMERQGAELWWPLLLTVLLFGAIEIVLAQWFSRSK